VKSGRRRAVPGYRPHENLTALLEWPGHAPSPSLVRLSLGA